MTGEASSPSPSPSPSPAAGDADLAGALAAIGRPVRVDDSIGVVGNALVFPPRAAWLRIRIDAPPGCHLLEIEAEAATGLRCELVTQEGTVPLPVALPADRAERVHHIRVRFVLEAPVEWLRLAPLEAGSLRVCRFALAAATPWRSLLADWRLGPVRLPVSETRALCENPAGRAPASWDARFGVDALENLELDGELARCGRAGVVRLTLEPPLPAGLHIVKADFTDEDGAPALVAPRLHLDGAEPNALPAAHFRRRKGTRYEARLELERPAHHLLLQPRQERGEVHVARLRARRRGPAGAALTLLRTGWVALAVPRLLAPLDRLVGSDPERDGPLRAVLRLLTRADLRYRRTRGKAEAARIERWLRREVRRDGVLSIFVGRGAPAARSATLASLAACDDARWQVTEDTDAADLTLPAGSTVVPEALAAIRRAPEGLPIVFDTDRLTLGLRSAPRFRAASPAADAEEVANIPLVLAHVPRGRALPTPAVPRRHGHGAQPSVSVITATKDAPEHLARFLTTLRRTAPAHTGLVLVDNGTTDAAALDLLAEAQQAPHTRVLVDDRPFNFAALNNLAVQHSDADILVFANNDIAFVDDGWLQALVDALGADRVGIAGALLDYPDGRVQHCGIALAGEARVRHIERFSPSRDVGYYGRRRQTTRVSAVTGALMAIRRRDFLDLGGFAAARYPVLYNDVDLCLRARRAGLEVVLASAARAVHHESVSFGARPTDDIRAPGAPFWRMARAAEADRFRQDWAHAIDDDPCYPQACDPVEAAFRALE